MIGSSQVNYSRTTTTTTARYDQYGNLIDRPADVSYTQLSALVSYHISQLID